MIHRSNFKGAALKMSAPRIRTGTIPKGKHNGVRRPSNSYIRDENYKMSAYGVSIRSAAGNAAIQRGS
jgi:hypothetical protein